MTGVWKWAALVAGFVLCLAIVALIMAFKVRDSARDESRWLVTDMWQTEYFNRPRGKTSESEMVNFMSLRKGASQQPGLAEHIRDQQCAGTTADCRLHGLSNINLLADQGKLEAVRGLLETAVMREDDAGVCPIGLESTLLRYYEAKLAAQPPAKAREVAARLVAKVKAKGGLLRDLRRPACDELAGQKPELFHAYVVLVGRVMQKGAPALFKQGAYIESSNKLEL
jgi:hypothetical protein